MVNGKANERLQTCTTALAVRQMANGDQPARQLSDLRGPMGKKLSKIQRQLRELQRYREMFGPLSGSDDSDTERDGTASRSNDGDDESEGEEV